MGLLRRISGALMLLWKLAEEDDYFPEVSDMTGYLVKASLVQIPCVKDRETKVQRGE
jgi:hypothetical protein